MNKTKLIVAVFLSVCILAQVGLARKKQKAKTIEELSDPTSIHYVPYPYPKNKMEVIEDLKHFIKEDTQNLENDQIDRTDSIYMNFLQSDSPYKVAKVDKIKNYTPGAGDYSWFIYIVDQDENLVLVTRMRASGLWAGSSVPGIDYRTHESLKYCKKTRRIWSLPTPQYAKDALARALGESAVHGIKKMKQVYCQSTMSGVSSLLWEIRMKDGTVYYYSILRDHVYTFKKRFKPKRSTPEAPVPLGTPVPRDPGDEYISDRLNDEIIVLRKLEDNTNQQ